VNLDASQSAPANQPKYVEKAINSLPALRFDGVDDYLLAPSVTNPGITNLSVFIVARFDDDADNLIQIMLSMQNGSGIGETVLQKINTNNSLRTVLGGSLLSAGSIEFKPQIYQVRYQNDTLYLAIDNGADSTMSIPLEEANGDWVIGANKNIGGFMHGDIAEIIVFNKALDEEERFYILKYLSKKWGIKFD
jgi:hypothetical protein